MESDHMKKSQLCPPARGSSRYDSCTRPGCSKGCIVLDPFLFVINYTCMKNAQYLVGGCNDNSSGLVKGSENLNEF